MAADRVQKSLHLDSFSVGIDHLNPIDPMILFKLLYRGEEALFIIIRPFRRSPSLRVSISKSVSHEIYLALSERSTRTGRKVAPVYAASMEAATGSVSLSLLRSAFSFE